MIKPHEYQQKGIDEIFEKFKSVDKLLYQLDTGGGKTVVFSFLSKEWKNKTNKKVLILCHREELINQSCETLLKVGVTYEKILPNVKSCHHNSDVYVAMIETLHRRLSKNKDFLKDVGLVISDECHVQIFNKVYDFFPESKILGVTATPVLLGRDTFYKCEYCENTYNDLQTCCGIETMEWSKPKKMSDIYQDIVVGPPIDYLIEFGQLVKEVNFVKKYADLNSLKTDSTGDFSKESQDKVFNNDEAVFNVKLNYLEICKGKRTIIFNSNTKVNKRLYDDFKSSGLNVRLCDSVNDSEGSRKELVKWFDENDDAILLNVGIFVAGFDNKEVQSIILNCATTSLSRYLQMCGRGGRSSNKIYKDHFVIIDGGGNIDRFNTWSDPSRDWHKIFFEGIGKPKPKKESIEVVKECPKCFLLMSRSINICPECGHQEEIKPIIEKPIDDSIFEPLNKIPYPNGEKIYKFTKSQNQNIHFAHKILINQILDLFILHRVTKDLYEKTKSNGRLDFKVSSMVRNSYFVLLKKKDIQTESNRTLKFLIDKAKLKIEKHYNRT